MHWRSLVVAVVGVVGTLALSGSTRDMSRTPNESSVRRSEVIRLQAHFDSVDAELRDRNVLDLTASRRMSRATLIGWLREYRDAGEFPRNDRFPDRAVPFFRDSDGVLCAMAYLIDRSGRGDIVDRVASTQNNGYIAELADDPALRAWLDSVGLSVREAARIQPSYRGDIIEDDDVSATYAVTSIVASGASLATVALNLISPTTPSGTVGIIAGGVGMLAGAVNIGESGGTQTVAAANIIIGGAAIAAGVYRLVNPQRAGTVDGLSRRSAGPEGPPAISPVVMQSSDGPRLGLSVNATF
jgi:hypothetical protein